MLSFRRGLGIWLDTAKKGYWLEKEASDLGYGVVESSFRIGGEVELSTQFRWIAAQLIPETMRERTPAQRNRK